MNRSKHAVHIAGRRTALAVAMALGLGLAGSVAAQSTTGRIFGQAAAGETVSVQGTSGTTREVTVDSQGRFDLSALPPGSYTVTLKKDGAVVDTRENVFVVVGSGTEVPFAAVTSLATVSVSANALPAIDISGVDSRTVVTSQQLASLPLVRTAEAVALLAPGVVPGSSLFTDANGFSRNLVSFGGSSVVENAYYLNGFNTTDPISGMGGLTLPYGAIDQQEILSGGYGAAYGRSDGGVISQIGKRGTNEWHFGGQLLYTPKELKSDPRSYYYVNADGSRGKIRQDRYDNKTWNATADAYFGGPLIANKLYIFGAVEADRVQGQSTGSDVAPYVTHYRTDNPKWYGKLDWNITDNNILEITGASNKSSYEGVKNKYDYATHTEGAFNSYDPSTKVGSDLYTAKFTSYMTDNLTFSALYGQMRGTLFSEIPGYDPTYPNIINPNLENPAITGGNQIINSQTELRITDPAHTSKNTNLRLDLSYKLGSHTLTAGIDNQNVRDTHDGQTTSGPGHAWEYSHPVDKDGNALDPSTWIVGGPAASADWQALPWVQAPGGYAGGETGYYVARYIYQASGSVRTTQRAQYLEDSWQVSDRWLVKLGLRNDQFTNYNSDSIPYLRLTSPQWAPRVGFSWDVNGDSSFKVYGNAGRYYLAMPASVALRAAGASLYTRQYYTYTGIDANGIPTGLTEIPTSTGGPISANLEYGIPRDPRTATSTNLKSEYQDEYILGFDKRLGPSWTYGVKATYRNLRNAIDDIGDAPSIQAKMDAMGIDPTTYDPDSIQGSYLINPGRTSIFQIPKLAGGYYEVPMDWVKDFHFNTTLKRKYYGVNFYLEHPFDGKWFGRVDYLYSRSYGNSEGQVRTDIGQTDVSATVDWDYAAVMDYANGDLANSRRHQIKAYGSYKLAPEWMVSGNVFIASGAPRTCLARYGGPNGTNPGLGYGPYYHFCRDGAPYSPGKQHEPWTYQVNLGAEYRPMWAEQKLAFNVNVLNVFDNQVITQRYPRSDNVNWLRPYGSQTARSVRFGITYDF